VLDISLPGRNGLDLQQQVAAERPDMPIIFITGYGDVPKTVQAMKAGAVEFLTKPFSNDALLIAIRQAVERSETILGQAAEMQTLRDRYASLSGREREVMSLVVAGLLNKQVGSEPRHQRNHREGTPRQDDAKNEGRLSGELGDYGCAARPRTCAESRMMLSGQG
jgi:FixJ family two-component response regulator